MAEHTAEHTVLCGANSYVRKFYLNPAFQKLPESIKRELQILCVSITEEASAEDSDYLFDEIASGMKIGRARFDHQELLEELELYYRVVFLGEEI